MQRRRGAQLETALLEAAWLELEERGYDALTIDGVADRAGTSRAVVYRRWPGKVELVAATIEFMVRRGRPAVPDTGSLRGDMVEMLRRTNTARAPLVTGLMIQIGTFYRDSGKSMADFRREILGDNTHSQQVIFDRAIARGEVDPARLTPRIRNLPWDLCRMELIMTLKPVPDETILEIIDDIFLPLVGITGASVTTTEAPL
ncbi:MAG TPA: TetR/AcrR family transcriptional regulator [Thermomicrobiales bacterium]|nr:TetR/AcrR family transcriptional regulator [Thermomicrobiales bacterium]